jgi:hypothetical protein
MGLYVFPFRQYIRGYGLKIEGDDEHKDEVGLFFDNGQNPPIKAEIVAVNEPRTLKAIVPVTFAVDGEYAFKVVTQSSAKHGAALLKNIREIRSNFKLTVQA